MCERVQEEQQRGYEAKPATFVIVAVFFQDALHVDTRVSILISRFYKLVDPTFPRGPLRTYGLFVPRNTLAAAF